MLRQLGTITIPAGQSRNNTDGTAAFLDLATKTTHVNSVIEAVSGGAGGNALTIAFAKNGGVALTIARVGSAFTVNYHDGVSTVTDFETALAALTGANKLIQLRTAGTGANILADPADTFTATNLAGGVDDSFAIPPTAKIVEALPSAGDLHIRALPDTTNWDPFHRAAYVPPFATPSTVAATSADYELDSGFYKAVPLGDYGAPSVVACYNGGATVATLDLFVRDP